MNAVKKSSFLSTISKQIGLFITIISLVVGSAIWVMAADNNAKQFAIDQTNAVRKDVESLIENYYASKEDIARIQQKIEEQNRMIDEVNRKLDKIIDRLIEVK